MTSRTRLNLALVLITCALVLVIIYRPGITPEAPSLTITGLDPRAVDKIHIERSGRDDLTLEKQEGLWFLAGTPARPAAELQARTLAGIAGETSITRYPAVDLDLEKLGLVNPAARIRLNDTEILYGITDPLEGNRYIRTGDTVHLIDDRYQRLVLADNSIFISTQLLADDTEIIRLHLPALEVARSADGNWTMTPTSPEVETGSITQLIDAWQNANALYVSTYEDTATTQGRITLYMAGKEPAIEFDIVSRTPELVLARPAWRVQYHLVGDMAAGLLELPLNREEPSPDD